MENRTYTIINKNFVDIHHQPISIKFHKAMEVFIGEGTKLDTAGQVTLTSMANDIINVFGVSVVSVDGKVINSSSPKYLPQDSAEGPVYTLSERNDRTHMDKNYSFKRDGNKDMGIENPNILDTDINMLTPELISAKDKFLDTKDPFYEQDDPELNSDTTRDKTIQENLLTIPIIPIANLMCAFCTIPTGRIYQNKYYNGEKLKTLKRDKG